MIPIDPAGTVAGAIVSYVVEKGSGALASKRSKLKIEEKLKANLAASTTGLPDAGNVLTIGDEETDYRLGDWLSERENIELVCDAALDDREGESTVSILVDEACDVFGIRDERTIACVRSKIRECADLCLRAKTELLGDDMRTLLKEIDHNVEQRMGEVKRSVDDLSRSLNEENGWAAYQDYLKDLEMPLFGTDLTGDQLYVPLLSLEVTEDPLRYVKTDEWLDNWVARADGGSVVFLSGDPGGGKSTVARMFTRRLSRSGKADVAFVKLRHFNEKSLHADGGLLRSIENYVNATGRFSIEIPRRNKPLVFVLDGLDEVAARGKSTRGLAGSVLESAMGFCVRCREEGAGDVKMLVTTRTVLMPEIVEYVEPSMMDGVVAYLELQPYAVRGNAQMPRNLAWRIEPATGLDKEMDPLYCRYLWWEKYNSLTGADNTKIRDAILRWDQRVGITVQPMVNHLVAILSDSVDFADVPNRSAVYEQLLRSVFERRSESVKGDESRHKSGFMTVEGHMLFLEAAAVCAWRNSKSSAIVDLTSLSEQISRREYSMDKNALRAELGEGGKDGIANCVIASYLRPTWESNSGDEAYEFVHNSFMEYLVSRWLNRFLNDNFGKSYEECESELFDALAYPGFTHNTLEFLASGISACKDAVTLSALRCWIVKMVDESLGRWFCKTQDEPFARSEEDVRFDWMRVNLLSMHSSISDVRENNHSGNEGLSIREGMPLCPAPQSVQTADVLDVFVFSAWMTSISDKADIFRTACENLSNLELSGLRCIFLEAERATIQSSTLDRAVLNGACFEGASMEMTSLNDASLYIAVFRKAAIECVVFDRSLLAEAIFDGAEISRSSFDGCDMTSALLRSATIDRCSLRGTKLNEAKLTNVGIRCSNFSNADLSNADLTGAVFQDCVLFADTNLTGAVFDETILMGAVFTVSSLSVANMKGARIIEPTPGNPLFELAGLLPAEQMAIRQRGPFRYWLKSRFPQ